jgi:RNA polymerase sigma-70 factor (ECF subfamily)
VPRGVVQKIALVRDEDKKAKYDHLVRHHSRALFSYSFRRLNDPTSCEDVVAETLLIAWRRWNDLPAPDKELAWLYAIAFRVLSNHRRSRDRRDHLYVRLAAQRDVQPDSDDSDLIDTGVLVRALGQLQTQERELLEFLYWERLSYREIALIVGASENAVGIRINRAKRKLRTLLELPQEENSALRNLRGEVES